MAMTHCKECDHQVSSKAETCPNCGAELKRKGMGCGGLIAFVFLGLVILGVISSIKDSLSDKPKQSATTTKSAAEKRAEMSPEQMLAIKQDAGLAWRYSTLVDQMTDATTYYAELKSTNRVNFKFPYNGYQHATLKLRTHPRYGKDVILRIEKGQLQCSSYDGCTVLVKFGDKPAVRYRANEAESADSTILFISNYHGFAGNMMKVDEVKISPKVYQEGSPVFTFDVKGFDADTYLGKTQ